MITLEIMSKLSAIESAVGAISVQEKKVLNTEEACAFLSVSRWALYHMTSRNQIPYAKHGRSLRFIRTELEKWVQSHQVKTADDIEVEATGYLNRNKAKGNRRQTW